MTCRFNYDASEQRAVANSLGAIDIRCRLPDKVFVEPYGGARFFQSDYIFSPDFPGIAGEFLDIEKSNICCLLNLDKSSLLNPDHCSAIFINNPQDSETYLEKLRGNGPSSGWLYGVDRYVCSSDIGEWCIYCEKANDIAVICFKNFNDVVKFESPLVKLCARPIEDLLVGATSLPPFNDMVLEWRNGLLKNYKTPAE